MDTSAPLLGEPVPIELMNTLWADREGTHDALSDRSELRGWLHALAPRLAAESAADLGAEPTARQLQEFRTLRDALRRLAATATDDPRPAAASPTVRLDAAVAAVNTACARSPQWSHLRWADGGTPVRTALSAQPPATAALATIAEQAVRLFAGPDRDNLRACEAPGCVLYFLRDHPRRAWCSAGCGNRARVARHYRRHHGDASTPEQGDSPT